MELSDDYTSNGIEMRNKRFTIYYRMLDILNSHRVRFSERYKNEYFQSVMRFIFHDISISDRYVHALIDLLKSDERLFLQSTHEALQSSCVAIDRGYSIHEIKQLFIEEIISQSNISEIQYSDI